MKKSVFMFCCALCIAFWGITANQAEAVMKLQLAHEQPEIHPYHIGAVEFAKLVKEYSKGEMEVTIFSNGTMGKASALAESCSMGTMDFDHPRGLFTEVRRFDNAVLFQGLGSFRQSS